MKAKILSALLYMRNVFTLLIILFLSSCLYSTKYIANYTVQNKSTEKSIKDVSIGFINQLAQKNQLRKDSTLKGTDTLGFYGSLIIILNFGLNNKTIKSQLN